MWKYNETDELYHYGILGMRWGRRKAKYTSKDYRQAKNIRKKKVSQMTNKELDTVNRRMNLENNYRNLNSQRNVGKKIVTAFTAGATTITAAVGAYEAYKKYGKQGQAAVGRVISKIGNLKG